LAGRFKTFRNRLAKAFSRNRSHLIIVLDVFMNLVLTAKKKNNYYVQESVGIALDLLAAIHNAGLVSLTYS
jgi:uncharacterized protein YcgI (DUF1989 family)